MCVARGLLCGACMTRARFANRPVLLTLVIALPAACGTPDWQPSPAAELALEDMTDPPLWTGDDTVAMPPPNDATPPGTLRAEGSAEITIHYINFSDGTTSLTKSASIDSASKNTSVVCGTSAFPKYGGSDANRKSFINGLMKMWADFNIVVTTRRPADPPYSMEMVGPPGNGCVPCTGCGGIAPMDCGNKYKENISFSFQGSPIVTGQESGHAWGLVHNDVECDVMGAGYSKKGCPSKMWGYPDVEGTTIGGGCTAGGKQNSYQMMIKNLGRWESGGKPDPWTWDGSLCSDMADPTVAIDEPADGATVGNKFDVKATGTDDCGVLRARISLPTQGLEASSSGPGPFMWSLDGLSDADDLPIIVEVWDVKGKMTARTIKVKVGMGSPPPPGGGGAGGGGATGGDGSGEDMGKGGCGCRISSSSPAPGLPSALGLVLALGAVAMRPHRR